MAKTIVMSLGGSLIAPDDLDINFLKKFRRVILDYIKSGNRVVLILIIQQLILNCFYLLLCRE